MKDPIQQAIETMCQQISQDVSYKLGDLIASYPREFRTVAIATVTACINSQLSTMPDDDRVIYDGLLANMEVVSIHSVMDPRKKGDATP